MEGIEVNSEDEVRFEGIMNQKKVKSLSDNVKEMKALLSDENFAVYKNDSFAIDEYDQLFISDEINQSPSFK